MTFEGTDVEGAVLIGLDRRTDERGWFARIWCADELRAQDLNPEVAQINSGFSPRAGRFVAFITRRHLTPRSRSPAAFAEPPSTSLSICAGVTHVPSVGWIHLGFGERPRPLRP